MTIGHDGICYSQVFDTKLKRGFSRLSFYARVLGLVRAAALRKFLKGRKLPEVRWGVGCFPLLLSLLIFSTIYHVNLFKRS